jgi:hypothetical protein
MIEKTQVFYNKEQWDAWKKKYCKDTRYHHYIITDPDDFPCIGIEDSVPSGDLGMETTIDTFVYRNDFI